DVTGLQEGQARLEKGQDAQGQELKALRADMGVLHQGQDNLGRRLDRLEIHIENKVIDKIKALFDDREVVMEALARIEKKLEVLDARLDEHDDQMILLRSKR
ncbi:MAG: hypothetical protein QME76_05510, partial [Bacillota bacterium]|nr:hypothetical protein [Bacillota bacterium]